MPDMFMFEFSEHFFPVNGKIVFYTLPIVSEMQRKIGSFKQPVSVKSDNKISGGYRKKDGKNDYS